MRKSLPRNTGLLILLMISAIELSYSQSNDSIGHENNESDTVENNKNNFLSDILNSENKFLADSSKQLPKIRIGGALRLNYSYKNYDQENMDRFGDFGFELFRINADIDYKDIFFSVE